MNVRILSSDTEDWASQIDELWQLLHPLYPKSLLPLHFVKSALIRIGGQIVIVRHSNDDSEALQSISGVGLLLPHPSAQQKLAYIMRYHRLVEHNLSQLERVQQKSATLLQTLIQLYDPTQPYLYTPTYQQYGEINIGHPDAQEAAAIRQLQQDVWEATDDYLYPSDLHSDESRLPTSLVARVDGEVAGYLFGFYSQDGPQLPTSWQGQYAEAWRLESQLMAVSPRFRGKRIGYLLKMVQAERARELGLDLVHWTVDPLLFPNAVLNFGLLRAVAFNFKPDLYPFRNALNRVPASRFQITWPIAAPEVQNLEIQAARPTLLDLAKLPEIVRVNQRHERPDLSATAQRIAVEVPRNWQQFQQEHPEQALQWRATTDQLFGHYLGIGSDNYVVSDVGRDGERCFLVAKRWG